MATPALSPRVQSVVREYGIFWQPWPQFEQTDGERRPVGLEVELIGSHPSDIKHVDPSCRMCYHVRAILLAIADRLTEDPAFPRNRLTYDIDTHSNSILCLPALGNRAAVPVGIHISWNHAPGSMCEGDLQNKIKTLLAKYGIHQR